MVGCGTTADRNVVGVFVKRRAQHTVRLWSACGCVLLSAAMLAVSCGNKGTDYVGAWLETSGQTQAMRIMEADDRLLAEVLDLTQAAGDQTVFTTEAEPRDDGSLRLSYESVNGEVVKGGTLTLGADGASLTWTDSTGASHRFKRVTVLPTSAPSP